MAETESRPSNDNKVSWPEESPEEARQTWESKARVMAGAVEADEWGIEIKRDASRYIGVATSEEQVEEEGGVFA